MWDPHVKAFLLLQAYMSRIELPISDYVGDQNSVLDQSIRIIQASIDVLTELGYFSSCVMMITLLQCIKSARWPQDGGLSIFPGLGTPEKISPKTSLPTLAEVAATLPALKLLGKLVDTTIPVSAQLRAQFEKAVASLPNVKLTTTQVNAVGLTVNLTRLNPALRPDFKIYAPKFPKPQTEGFFIVITDPDKDEVLGLKRVGWSTEDTRENNGGRGHTGGSQPTARAQIKLLESEKNRKLDIWVLSDSYIELQ